MGFNANFHTHTCFDDGKDTPEEIVASALGIGFTAIGFTAHSYMPFESDWLLRREDESAYLEKITGLKKEYAGRIRVYNGLEKDYFSDQDPAPYDYVIGSVHCIEKGGSFFDVDDTEEVLTRACEEYYGGDFYALAEDYYGLLGDVHAKTGCDIVGHFDLLTKFNEGGKLFDTSDDRYVSAWKGAADSLLETGAQFEINTGAMARGLRTGPYPAFDIYSYLNECGATFILTSDCHSKDMLTYGFDRVSSLYDVYETIPDKFV